MTFIDCDICVHMNIVSLYATVSNWFNTNMNTSTVFPQIQLTDVAYRKTILSVMADFYMEELEERMLQ